MQAFADAGRWDQALVSACMAILLLAAAYLIVLGIMVLSKPARARSFLSGFAQSTVANVAESGLRLLVGLAFVGASSQTKNPLIAVAIGVFLAVSALLMVALPGLHRRFAAKSTASLFGFLRPFGLASLVLAAALLWFIA